MNNQVHQHLEQNHHVHSLFIQQLIHEASVGNRDVSSLMEART